MTKTGNPIEICRGNRVAIWDTAKAIFEVDDYSTLHQYSGVKLRSDIGKQLSVRQPGKTTKRLLPCVEPLNVYTNCCLQSWNERLGHAGIRNWSAYQPSGLRPEIAQAMLQRQQATAVVAARQQIVEGAVEWLRWPWQSSRKETYNLTKNAKPTWWAICW